jgi:hypothetical protein
MPEKINGQTNVHPLQIFSMKYIQYYICGFLVLMPLVAVFLLFCPFIFAAIGQLVVQHFTRMDGIINTIRK